MKKILFLLLMIFSLAGCSDLREWHPNGILQKDAVIKKKLSSDTETDSKYNLEEKVEKNF
jgi:hypothetical protein